MKKLILRTALAASAALAFAGVANAAVTVTVTPADINYAQDLAAVPDSAILWDFDTIAAAGYNYVPLSATTIGSVPNLTRAPLGDDTVYGSVNPGNSPSVFTTTAAGLESFSLLIGSPDTYNRIQFIGLDGVTVIGDLTGAAAFGPGIPTNGQNIARRFNYDFGGARVGTVNFYSTDNAFEFDRISGVVPEPATWAMMLVGFFGLGATLRSTRKLTPARAA